MFLTIYIHHFGWLSESGGNFLNLLQKERGGYLERGVWGSLRKGVVPTPEETMCINLYQYGKICHKQLLEMFTSFYLIFKCSFKERERSFIFWIYVPFSRYSGFCIFKYPMICQICEITMSISP